MPLRRGSGTPVMAGLEVDFDMVSDADAVVSCTITRAAIETLARAGAPQPPGQFDVYSTWREEIERIASHKFDAGLLDNGRVMIDAADVSRAGLP